MRTHRWNPYVVGALIGVLSIIIFSIANKPIGMSTAVVQASGAVAVPILGSAEVGENTYWTKKAVPAWDYGSLFLLGTFLGALGSALTSGSFKFGSVPRSGGIASDRRWLNDWPSHSLEGILNLTHIRHEPTTNPRYWSSILIAILLAPWRPWDKGRSRSRIRTGTSP